MVFDKEFKEAIKNLPSARKDQLILRLLKKDLRLANRLYFELIDSRSVDDRRLELEEKIETGVKRFSESYYSLGYLMMDLRYLSGDINEHVNVTKDKFGEVSLNLLMLNITLELNNKRIENSSPSKCNKLCVYIIAKTFKILSLIVSLHEDYRMDFDKDLKKLGQLIGSNHYLMMIAIHHGFDVNWLLLDDNIPPDISTIAKDLRKAGYLK